MQGSIANRADQDQKRVVTRFTVRSGLSYPSKKEVMIGIILSNLILILCRRTVIITSQHSSVVGGKPPFRFFFQHNGEQLAAKCRNLSHLIMFLDSTTRTSPFFF